MASLISKIPSIGFGLGTTWFRSFVHNTEGELDHQVIESLIAALQAGFRHLDLAEMYGNEREVGVALNRWFSERETAGESRSEARANLWITSKLWDSMNENIIEGCRNTIARLGCDYLDLYLVHGSVALFHKRKTGSDPALTNIGVWRQMEALVELGIVKQIGLSNFAGSEINELFTHSLQHPPVMHQVEFHPLLQQPELQRISESHGMKMASYGGLTPLRHETPSEFSSLLTQIAQHYHISEAAVLQRYAIQRGFTVITTTKTPARLHQALAVLNHQLSEEHVHAIDHLGATPAFQYRAFWPKEITLFDAGFL